MRLKICILFKCVVMFYALPSFAVKVTAIPRSPTQMAEDRITSFISLGADSPTGKLSDLEISGLPAIHLSLKVYLQHFKSSVDLTPQKVHRMSLVLQKAADTARTIGPKVNHPLKSAIKIQVDELLVRLFRSGERPIAAIQILDYLDLWTVDNFWFFENIASNPNSLIEHRSRIQKLIPEFNEDQLDLLSSQLRSHSMEAHVRLSLLFDMDRITVIELTKFLLLMANRFASNLAKENNESSSPLKAYYTQKIELIFAHTVNRLIAALHTEDQTVLSAYDRAKTLLIRQGQTSNREAHLHFMQMLLSPHFDWMNRSTWKVKPSYVIDGNIVKLDFPDRSDCQRHLE